MKIPVEFEDLIKKALDEASQNSTLIELISSTSFKVRGFVFEIRFRDKIVSLHQQKSRKRVYAFCYDVNHNRFDEMEAKNRIRDMIMHTYLYLANKVRHQEIELFK